MDMPSLVETDHLKNLILTLAMAGVFSWLINRFGSRRTRAIVDRMAGAHSPAGGAAARITESGARPEGNRSIDRTTYPVTMSLKLLSTVLTVGIMAFLIRQPTSLVSQDHQITLFSAICALALWYMAYIWNYSIVVERDRILVPSYFFKPTAYDLNDLQWVEEDGAYSWRLIFADGRKPLVLKQLHGQAELIALFDQYSSPQDARTARS